MKKITAICALAMAWLAAGMSLSAQNPYMPLWEYIPDGEPYVFEDPDCPGKERVYVYGSHDSEITKYCGREQVVWSAPVEDLTNWRYDGIIFRSDKDANGENLLPDGRGDILYAPDVAVKTDASGKKWYYLYPNNQSRGRNAQVCRSERPDGPFEVINWNAENPKRNDGILGFDPAVFVDDDGRVYGYWGFEESNGAELDPVLMDRVKEGTEIHKDMVSNYKQPGVFNFFEASSMRKIDGKYVFIYSRKTQEGEFGLPQTNYTLAYAYGDSPLGPWTYGGTLVDCRGRDTDAAGNVICTANPYGNTHGSLAKVGDQWWLFYHRQCGTDEYSRQAMVSPVSVTVEPGKGGKVCITEAEYNSEGFRTEGLNPLYKTPAGLACYYTNPKGIGQDYPKFIFSGSYIKASRIDFDSYVGPFSQKQPLCPVINNTSGSVVGYKYFNFSEINKSKPVSLKLHMVNQSAGKISVLVGGPDTLRSGKVVAEIEVAGPSDGRMVETMVPCSGFSAISGKQPLFFRFTSEGGESICEIYDFQFVQ